tara:strand:+ start:796 stop:921 length:126 start_codon:yes stop_codon:yes gene_type:complete
MIKYYFLIFSVVIFLFDSIVGDEIITILGTTNVKGEIDPCG